MGGFFGVASKQDCIFDLFLALTIILILEQGAAVWRCMEKMGLIVPFTT